MSWKTSVSKISDDQEIIRGQNLQELIKIKSFAEVIFLVLKGSLPNDNETRMTNALLVACIDHGVGAPSATVARTVASTGNSLHTAVSAGIQTLGDLHGGAIEGSAKFFQEHVGESDLENLLKNLKEKKVRIPGFGHKVLNHDNRSDSLFAIAKEVGFFGKHCQFATETEAVLNKISSKSLPLNIDGSMAAIISDMGFDWKIAKGFFIIGRVPGLVAHVFEQLQSGEGIKRIDESEIEYI